MTGRGHGYNCENDHVLISCILIVRFMHEQFWNANYYPEKDQNDQDYDYYDNQNNPQPCCGTSNSSISRMSTTPNVHATYIGQ